MTIEELDRRRRELGRGRALRALGATALSGCTPRERGEDGDLLDAPDAAFCDLWWLLLADAPIGDVWPRTIWRDAHAEGVCSELGRMRTGCLIAGEEGGRQILVVDQDKHLAVAWLASGEPAIVEPAMPFGWGRRGELRWEQGRLVGVTWSQRRPEGGPWQLAAEHEIVSAPMDCQARCAGAASARPTRRSRPARTLAGSRGAWTGSARRCCRRSTSSAPSSRRASPERSSRC